MLNAKPEHDEKTNYNVVLQVGGVLIADEFLNDKTWYGNPLSRPVRIEYDLHPDDSDADYTYCMFAQTDLKKMEPQQGRFTFQNAEGQVVVLTKVVAKTFDMFSAF